MVYTLDDLPDLARRPGASAQPDPQFGARSARGSVLAGVVGRDGDRALSPFSGHGEAPVGVDTLDAPELPVADGFVVVGAQGAVVSAGDDDVAGTGGLATGDRDGGSFVEVAEVAAGVLDGSVESVELFPGEPADDDEADGETDGA